MTSQLSSLSKTVRDLASHEAEWAFRQGTVGEYLARVGVYDPHTRAIYPEKIPDSVYQRAKIEISKNPIKKRMLRDVLRGGTLPAIVTIQGRDGAVEIADGLQRTHVLSVAAEGVLAMERGDPPPKEVRAQLAAMEEQEQEPLDLDGFLSQPLVEQVWRGLRSDEKLRLFMVLNVGQQKVSPRHLLEVARSDLRATFEDWGIRLLTEREEREMPRRRGRPPKDSPAVPGVSTTHYKYELLIDSLQAYVSGDPHIQTRHMLEGERLSDKFDSRITEVASEACRDDFKWVCLELNPRIQERYEGTSKWALAVQNNANFVIPVFAALGKARDEAETGSTVRHHQQELLELLDQPGDDPLNLFSGPDSLDSIYETVRSNIGRRKRAIVFFAWRALFLRGPSSADTPLNWRDAEIGS